MRENITNLINSRITAHTVSVETGLPRNTVYRIFSGEANLDNVSLKNAEVLNDYYIKNKEMLNMQNIVEEIREKYNVDGENERYIEIYNNANEVVEEMEKEQFEEKFLSGYVQKSHDINKLNYPIITFDYSGDADGQLFESDEDEKEILESASKFFESK